MEMPMRMRDGRLKVTPHLADWFDEYRGYHRKDGLIVKINDDLMSQRTGPHQPLDCSRCRSDDRPIEGNGNGRCEMRSTICPNTEYGRLRCLVTEQGQDWRL
jgi:hypothetical protein